ncbi:hypothetical protein Q361_1327 [Flavobacterium croceum DSM 17960]|jgi:hypothetical protein|uniref:Lipocalin-like protein n=1 Tax=Flavobacterium croceum DSM 17960 TaxID=1121886 RepID=A0A2S4N4L7_9FLAO|nr:hypothetical protein [Flavobacterium croceum]POS00678.1 hypothetical protein Q361_1327 [Flavobacterium croceum DSM 17960]
MINKKKHINSFLAGFLTLFFIACNNNKQTKNNNLTNSNVLDSVNHGYNELANPNKLKNLTVSDYNSDNLDVENIVKPKKSTINTKLDTNLLFGIWTLDPKGPHADFELTNKSFFVVDYDGNGNMPYELIDNNLKIYYNDFTQEGHIVSVDKDTLKIIWEHTEHINSYVKWTN